MKGGDNNALVYAWYSTHKQDGGISIEKQIARCQEYGMFKGFGIVDKIQDLAISGVAKRAFDLSVDFLCGAYGAFLKEFAKWWRAIP